MSNINEKMPDQPGMGSGEEQYKEKIEYVDKRGQVHFFETTDQLVQFKEDENNRDNRS